MSGCKQWSPCSGGSGDLSDFLSVLCSETKAHKFATYVHTLIYLSHPPARCKKNKHLNIIIAKKGIWQKYNGTLYKIYGLDPRPQVTASLYLYCYLHGRKKEYEDNEGLGRTGPRKSVYFCFQTTGEQKLFVALFPRSVHSTIEEKKVR